MCKILREILKLENHQATLKEGSKGKCLKMAVYSNQLPFLKLSINTSGNIEMGGILLRAVVYSILF